MDLKIMLIGEPGGRSTLVDVHILVSHPVFTRLRGDVLLARRLALSAFHRLLYDMKRDTYRP